MSRPHCIYVSSSVSNFREKLLARTRLPEWSFKTISQLTIFFGCYHIGDYVRLLFHRGGRIIFWCGSDILQLEKSLWRYVIRKIKSRHICENRVEQGVLERMGIYAEIHPMIFEPPEDIPISFIPSERPHVYVTCHDGSQEAYGVNYLEGIATSVPDVTFHIYGVEGESHDNVVFHGQIKNEVFNREIRHYQGALRLNSHDGFSEILAKSVLMGQYPISFIFYPEIDFAPDSVRLIRCLNNLKHKKKPNHQAAKYWSEKLEESLWQILNK